MNKLEGIFTALITPFHADGSLDEAALRNLVDKQIDSGITGLVPVGTTGESPTLSHKEHHEVIRIVVEQANKRVPIIAGTGSNSTQEAIELTIAAKELGADASLQVAPYYNKPSQQGFLEHFTAIAEQSQLPLILYNIPGRTGKNIEVATIVHLSEHPMIVGVKEATGNITQAIDIMQKVTKKNFSVISGDDALTLGMMVHGASGVISVASNVFPQHMSLLTQKALSGDFISANKLFFTLLPFFQATFIDTNPVPIKYAASVMGICKETYRLPLCSLSDIHKQSVKDSLQKVTTMLQQK